MHGAGTFGRCQVKELGRKHQISSFLNTLLRSQTVNYFCLVPFTVIKGHLHLTFMLC